MALPRREVVVVVVERGMEAAVGGGHARDVVEGGVEGGGGVEVGFPGGVGTGFDGVEGFGAGAAGVLGLEAINGRCLRKLVRIKS